MESNLLNLEKYIKESVLSYYRTAYSTNDEDLNIAIQKALEEGGDVAVFKEPLLELAKRYQEFDKRLSDFIETAVFNGEGLTADVMSALLNMFRTLGVDKPYKHQVQAVIESLKNDKHVIVTTGTGSGKTYCFVIPLLLSLLSEAVGTGGRSRWSGSSEECTSGPWWRNADSGFTPIRSGANRTQAIRCLVIYPLNALVQDQIEMLRGILNSKEAKSLYDDVLHGDRIYFGQYNGMTPGGKTPDDQIKLEACRKYLNDLEADREGVVGNNHVADSVIENVLSRLQDPLGSELITRWDMQRTPPDIFITNFSMLSIMLVREIEQNMLEQTKLWLQESTENKFYLVLDELHTYRGTAGTEIGYTVRIFLERIGLHPEHPQLRIIATSASLDEGDDNFEDPQYIREFFGTSKGKKRFSVISGPTVEPSANCERDAAKLGDCGGIFADYYRGDRSEDSATQALDRVEQKYSYGLKSAAPVNEFHLIENSLAYVGKEVSKYYREIEFDGYPFKVSDIKREVFNGVSDAANGFMEIILRYPELLDSFSGKLRSHHFVKNLPGLSRAMSVRGGKLSGYTIYDSSTKYCYKSQSMNLEMLYCQVCGEVFYRGYLRGNGLKKYVVNDVIDKSDKSLEYVYLNFSLNTSGEQIPGIESWGQRYFNGVTGKLSTNEKEAQKGDKWAVVLSHICHVENEPTSCPSCETDWKRSGGINHPIRTMGTGYHKLNQVVIEQTLRSMSGSKSHSRPKLVVFSDSRRDSAHISAELEYNHYRDSLRSTAECLLRTEGGGDEQLKDYVAYLIKHKKQPKTHPYEERYPAQASLLAKHFVQGLFDENNPDDESMLNHVNELLQRGSASYYSISWLVNRCMDSLIDVGMNPTGVRKNGVEDEWLWPTLLKLEGYRD